MSKPSKTRIRFFAAIALCVAMLAGTGVTAYAAGVNKDLKGTLTIQPRYNGSDVNLGTFDVYYVAEIVDYDKPEYKLINPFSKSNVDINNVKSASNVRTATTELIKQIGSVDKSDVIIVKGGETVSNLDLGIYLVINRNVSGFYTTAAPFLAILPIVDDGEWVYEYTAYPKLGYDEGKETTTKSTEETTVASTEETTTTGTEGTTTSERQEVTTTNRREQTTVVSRYEEVTTVDDTFIVDDDLTPQGLGDVPEGESEDSELFDMFSDGSPLGAPQTGMLQWPVPVLGTLGCLLTGGGLFAGRGKKDNEED